MVNLSRRKLSRKRTKRKCGGIIGDKKRKSKSKRKGNKIFVYFHMPNCPYCVQFEPMWKNLKKKKKDKGILFRKLDGTKPENSDFTETFGIKSYPTLVLVKGSTFKTYKKKRTLKDLIKFIN